MKSSHPFQVARGKTVPFAQRGHQRSILASVLKIPDCNRLPFREKIRLCVCRMCVMCAHICDPEVDIDDIFYCSYLIFLKQGHLLNQKHTNKVRLASQ